MKIVAKAQIELINQQIKEIIGLYMTTIANSGISENEFWIWYTLIEIDGDHSQQDICRMWSLSKQTVNTIIMRIVKDGYAELEAVPGTRNRKVIRLSETGKKYGENIIRPVTRMEERALERISLEDRVACMTAFSKYIEAFKEELNGKLQKERSLL